MQRIDKTYFIEKHYKLRTEENSEFDIIIKSNCSKLAEEGVLCNICFHEGLVDKISSLTSLEVLGFINYQIKLYDTPVDFLKRFQAFINDNEDKFEAINNNVLSHLKDMIRAGIQQLTKKDTEEKIAKGELSLDQLLDQGNLKEALKLLSMNFIQQNDSDGKLWSRLQLGNLAGVENAYNEGTITHDQYQAGKAKILQAILHKVRSED